jgi:hypothetical protein
LGIIRFCISLVSLIGCFFIVGGFESSDDIYTNINDPLHNLDEFNNEVIDIFTLNLDQFKMENIKGDDDKIINM